MPAPVRSGMDATISARDGMGVLPWVVSGRGTDAMRAQGEQLRAYASASSSVSAEDIGFSLAATRSALKRRAVVIGEDGRSC